MTGGWRREQPLRSLRSRICSVERITGAAATDRIYPRPTLAKHKTRDGGSTANRHIAPREERPEVRIASG